MEKSLSVGVLGIPIIETPLQCLCSPSSSPSPPSSSHVAFLSNIVAVINRCRPRCTFLSCTRCDLLYVNRLSFACPFHCGCDCQCHCSFGVRIWKVEAEACVNRECVMIARRITAFGLVSGTWAAFRCSSRLPLARNVSDGAGDGHGSPAGALGTRCAREPLLDGAAGVADRA